MQFPGIPGLGLLLVLVRWLVPRYSWRRALWVLFSASPCWGLFSGFGVLGGPS